MRSKSQQKLARDLHAIQEARKLMAEARLADARQAAGRAADAQSEALERLGEAESAWSGKLTRGPLNVELEQCLARELVGRENDALEARRKRGAADAETEQRLTDWQRQEAVVRNSEQALRIGRRKLAGKLVQASTAELADRISWNWFRR